MKFFETPYLGQEENQLRPNILDVGWILNGCAFLPSHWFRVRILLLHNSDIGLTFKINSAKKSGKCSHIVHCQILQLDVDLNQLPRGVIHHILSVPVKKSTHS